jgi:DTW domain-containing protein YfiP
MQQDIDSETFREVCLRCRRAKTACYCALIPTIASKTHVVFLQHPRERYVAIGTARMAHLGLPNSEFHVAERFDANARVQALAETAKADGTALLFPGEGAQDLSALRPEQMPKNLVVIDGTWALAKKLLRLNPLLQTIPRVMFRPTRPSNYRIRAEPKDHFVSTIEAVVEVLGQIESDREKFLPMLKAFESMVDLQIEKREARTSPPRRRLKTAKKTKLPPVPMELKTRASDLVVMYAEANAHPLYGPLTGAQELLQWAAVRVATGERFYALVQPRLPLAESTPHHLEMTAAALAEGEPVEAAVARFKAFLRKDDLLALWGPFSLGLLMDEGVPTQPWVDLRRASSRLLKRRPGGIEAAATFLDAPSLTAPWAPGRAGRRLVALQQVLVALQAKLD